MINILLIIAQRMRGTGSRARLAWAVCLAAGGAGLEAGGKTIHPWENLLTNTGGSFTSTNSLYHIGGAAATAGMVFSGADAGIRDTFRRHDPLGGTTTADTAVIVGSVWHVVPAAGMYGWGLHDNDSKTASAGAAGLQALGITMAVVQLEKFVFGRRAPIKSDPAAGFAEYTRSDDPADFDMRFWQIDRRSGRHIWPSGHTASAAAFTAAMHSFYNNDTIAFIGYPLTLLMGLAMIEGDFHWGSDVVAGALTGMVIGYTVGQNFRQSYIGASNKGGSTATGKTRLQSSGLALTPRSDGYDLRLTLLY